jgi:hypothetical protein
MGKRSRRNAPTANRRTQPQWASPRGDADAPDGGRRDRDWRGGRLLVRTSREGSSDPRANSTGRPQRTVFTVSQEPERVTKYLMKIAERLSAQDVQAGASGQVSVMVWPDDVPVPKEPPTTEFDASMKTQAAGIFINPKLNIKHVIRFRDGQTLSERDFGKKVQ